MSILTDRKLNLEEINLSSNMYIFYWSLNGKHGNTDENHFYIDKHSRSPSRSIFHCIGLVRYRNKDLIQFFNYFQQQSVFFLSTYKQIVYLFDYLELVQ